MSEPPGAAIDRAARAPGGGDAAIWAGLAAGAALLAVLALGVAPPLSRLLFPPLHYQFFGVWIGLVHPKPVQETRYLLAVGLTILLAVGLARAGAGAAATAGAGAGVDARAGVGFGRLRTGARTVSLLAGAAKLAVGGAALWSFRRYELAAAQAGVGHFRLLDLAAATGLALVLAGLVWWHPALVAPTARVRGRWSWPGLAMLATGCWLLPALFRNRNIGHALFVMWWHLQFVYGDFLATLGGRTPLVDYNAEYGSLIPLVLEEPLRILGPSVGAFTGLMCLLTLGSLLAVERSLAQLCASERLALVLYLPFLATSLFTDYHRGVERFYFADYYGVFPLRYLGPYVLLWLCVRHLRGRRPRGAAWLFLIGGLATLNDIEFGLPALAAAGLALAAAAPRSEPVGGWLPALLRAAALGVGGALAGVSLVLLLRTGQLIELSRLSRYATLFGRAGFGEVSTPTIGLHLVMYATFVANLALAAARHRRTAPDRALTGALAYAGVFGLGAGSYYMGGSNPSQLIGVFSAWSLGAVLLGLLAVRALAARRLDPAARAPAFGVAGALVMLGLLATALTQVPAPWTQLRRIDARAAAAPYDRTAASAFVRRTAAPGEKVVVLEGLGPLIAREAGVENVSPYSEVWAVWSREQLAEILTALRRARGTRFYLGRAGADPGIGLALAAAGFRRVAYDAASQLTLWRRAG